MLESLEQIKNKVLFNEDKELASFVAEESETFFNQGKPLLAAASYLSVNDFRSSLISLIRNNELYIAYYLSKFFYPQALFETTELICEKLEKYF